MQATALTIIAYLKIQTLSQKIEYAKRLNDIEVQQVQHRGDEALAYGFKYQDPSVKATLTAE